jgi:hypothetical protein
MATNRLIQQAQRVSNARAKARKAGGGKGNQTYQLRGYAVRGRMPLAALRRGMGDLFEDVESAVGLNSSPGATSVQSGGVTGGTAINSTVTGSQATSLNPVNSQAASQFNQPGGGGTTPGGGGGGGGGGTSPATPTSPSTNPLSNALQSITGGSSTTTYAMVAVGAILLLLVARKGTKKGAARRTARRAAPRKAARRRR